MKRIILMALFILTACDTSDGTLPDCYDGETECSDNTVTVCSVGEWYTVERCAGQCVMADGEAVCVE